jgi:hypothetical protein
VPVLTGENTQEVHDMQATREFRRGYQPLGLIAVLLAALVIAAAAGFLIRGWQQASPASSTVSGVSAATSSGHVEQGPDALERDAQGLETVGVEAGNVPAPTHGAVP